IDQTPQGEDEEAPMEQVADRAPTPEERVLGKELSPEIKDCLDQLHESYRVAITLELEGLTLPEVAEACGVTYGAANMRRHHAHGRLRDLLAARGYRFISPGGGLPAH